MAKTPSPKPLGIAAHRLKPARGNLIADLIAGITFAVVSVPQAMAHALLALVNPLLGIYTLVVAEAHQKGSG